MIRFFIEDVRFNLKNKRLIKNWLCEVAKTETKKIGEINFIFCSDKYILELNKKHLNHDYYTDVIAFDYCESNILSGDIYISVDTVCANSKEYSQSFDIELNRVMVHAVLHLCKYNDSTKEEISLMHLKEDSYLKKITI